MLGLWTRRAALSLIAIMPVAIISTKVPIFLTKGLWAMALEARTNWSMLLSSIFLLLGGPGPFSLPSRLGKGSAP